MYFFPGKSPPKSALDIISCVNFCKLVQIMKKIDTTWQGVPPFGRKLK